MDWLLLVGGFIAGTIQYYSHQTSAVANSSYPIVEPFAKVSVIVPAFNEEPFIERTLLCIKSQNIYLEHPEKFEIIVVDNGSTDNTVRIAMEHAKVITSTPGKLWAKHAGVEASEGDLLVFVDADAIMKPNFLNLILRHFHKRKVVAVAGAVFVADNDLIQRIFHIYTNMANGFLTFFLPGGITAIRKKAYYDAAGYDLSVDQFERNTMMWEEEYEFLRRLKQVGKVIVDTEASMWDEPRREWCLTHSPDMLCTSPYCLYCRAIEKGQRF